MRPGGGEGRHDVSGLAGRRFAAVPGVVASASVADEHFRPCLGQHVHTLGAHGGVRTRRTSWLQLLARAHSSVIQSGSMAASTCKRPWSASNAPPAPQPRTTRSEKSRGQGNPDVFVRSEAFVVAVLGPLRCEMKRAEDGEGEVRQVVHSCSPQRGQRDAVQHRLVIRIEV